MKCSKISIGVGLALICAGCQSSSVQQVNPDVKTAEMITDVSQGWARLYDEKGFKGKALTVRGGFNSQNLENDKTDEGERGFEDKASAVRFQIPKGWKLVLFEDKDFKSAMYELKGTGKVVENTDLGSFSDKASSARWDRDPE
jgi:hypothetical protein